jgi:hypothetical protein
MNYLVVSSWINLHVEKKMTIDIFLIFCLDILAMILFRILPLKKSYFKNLSKNGRNSIVNISKTKSRRYIFLCIFGKSMSKLTKSRIFMKKSIGTKKDNNNFGKINKTNNHLKGIRYSRDCQLIFSWKFVIWSISTCSFQICKEKYTFIGNVHVHHLWTKLS